MRMIRRMFAASCVATILAFGLPMFVAPASAQGRPKNATAQCKDGTYSSAKTKQGACSKHGGVQTWFADEKAGTAVAAPTTPKPSAAPTPTAAASDAPKGGGTTKTTGKATAKPSADAPPNATAKCKDGSYSFAKQHSGACSHHGGVAEWYK